MKTISKTRDYAFAIGDVWDAITDSDALSEWLMPNDFEAKLGHKFTFRTSPKPGFDGIVHCQICKLNPPNELEMTWCGGGIDTRLNIQLEDLGDRTRLTLRHSGFQMFKDVVPWFFMSLGWSKILKRHLTSHLDDRVRAIGAVG